MILSTAAVPAVHQARARSAEFSENPPRLSGAFPSGPDHPGEPPSAVEPKWELFAPNKPRLGLIGGLVDILSGASEARKRKARERFNRASEDWRRERYQRERAELAYRDSVQNYENSAVDHRTTRAALENKLLNELERYTAHKSHFEKMRTADLATFDALLKNAAMGSQEGIEALADLVLRLIPQPIAIVGDAEVCFDVRDGILLFAVMLPNLEETGLGIQLKTKFRDATEKEIGHLRNFLSMPYHLD